MELKPYFIIYIFYHSYVYYSILNRTIYYLFKYKIKLRYYDGKRRTGQKNNAKR